MNAPETPDMVIAGAGAMGCLLAGRLAPVLRVAVLDSWRQGIFHLRTHGIRMECGDETLYIPPLSAHTDPHSWRNVPRALVVVKAWQTENVARQLAACLHRDGRVLTLQNGLGNRERLAGILGDARVFQGVTSAGATLLGPGHVRLAGRGSFSLPLDSQLDDFEDVFAAAGLEVTREASLEEMQWRKLAINCAINPLTALLRAENGRLLDRGDLQSIMRVLVEEVVQTAGGKGIRLDAEAVFDTVLEVARRTSDNRSSMLQDVLRGAPTEIESLNGAVVQAGKEAGVATPYNACIYQLVQGMNDLQRGEDG